MSGIITRSASETKKIASILASEARQLKVGASALVIALTGNLGSGKTTFTQGFARALGIKERVLSPTFVLEKIYPIQKKSAFTYLVHIDCYRLRSPRDLSPLGIKKVFKDSTAIILIEWPERIRNMIPRNALWIRFKHGKKQNERIISFQIPNNK